MSVDFASQALAPARSASTTASTDIGPLTITTRVSGRCSLVTRHRSAPFPFPQHVVHDAHIDPITIASAAVRRNTPHARQVPRNLTNRTGVAQVVTAPRATAGRPALLDIRRV